MRLSRFFITRPIFAAVIAIVGLIPPIGFYALPATGLWVLVTSVVMAVQASREAPAVPAA